MAKKLFWAQNKLSEVNEFKPGDRLISNFESAKFCKVDGLFAKAVAPLSQ